MLKLLAVHNISTTMLAEYAPDADAYNITSGFMSDDCIPYRLSKRAMLWLDQTGFLGDWSLDKFAKKWLAEPFYALSHVNSSSRF